MSTRAFVRSEFYSGDVELYLQIPAEKYDEAQYLVSLQFETHPEGALVEPLRRQPNQPQLKEIMQALLDAAWENGMRPSGYGDVKESVAAVKAHLSDMRMIAFHKIGVKQ